MNPNEVVKVLGKSVTEYMLDSFGIKVTATYDEIQVGGMLSKKIQPGVIFNFVERPKYAGVIVGINSVAAMMTVNMVQRGAPSSAYQRMNVAESKGPFSLGGMVMKTMTNTNAVEEESMYYSALRQAVQSVVESWGE